LGCWRANLVKQGAALGLLGVDVPEAYGGIGLDKSHVAFLSETWKAGRYRRPRATFAPTPT